MFEHLKSFSYNSTAKNYNSTIFHFSRRREGATLASKLKYDETISTIDAMEPAAGKQYADKGQ
jgi:hypothetical protein